MIKSGLAGLVFGLLLAVRTVAAPAPAFSSSQSLPTLSPAPVPNALRLGGKFFRTTITRNKEPLLAEAYYEDTENNLIVQGPPLVKVIAMSYGVQDYQVVDGPEWIYQSHLYDIKAAPPPTFIESDQAAMVKAMLADRFAFTATTSIKEITTLALVMKEGITSFDFPAAQMGGRFGVFFVQKGNGEVDVRVSLEALAQGMTRAFKQPVRNLTGLSGIYHLTLRQEDVGDRTIFNLNNMLLEKLGLTLETRSASMQVISITHIEPPHLDD